MAPSAVLLDLDGTLIDSHPGIQASCIAALRALGHEPSEGFDIRASIGPPLEEIIHNLLQSFGDGRVEEGVAAYRQHYGESGYRGSVLYPGIADALSALKRSGARLYLATSKRELFARRILEHLRLADQFDGIYGSIPGGARDHKPELLAFIVAQHRLDPSQGVMVGDRRYDVIGARAVGMRSLGVLWGYGERRELVEAGADGLVEVPAELARAALAPFEGRR
ncbi:MAG: HAD hydrolase-like protein [Elsteraceae bacterium]